MLKREIVPPPPHIYPPDEWRLVEARWSPATSPRSETTFALSNGYIGTRGTVDEGRPALSPGTFLNGFHETWPIVHAEGAYGLARTGQTMVSVPDATVLKLYVDDEPLDVSVVRMTEYRRVLDMRAGVLERDLVWSTGAGKHVHVRSRRLVSLEHRHLMAISYEVSLLDDDAPVTVSSKILNQEDLDREDVPNRAAELTDPRLASSFGHRVLERCLREVEGDRILLGYRTATSGMTMAIGVDHVISSDSPHETKVEAGHDVASVVVRTDLEPGQSLRIVKYVAYQYSRSRPPEELAERCRWTLDRAATEGFDALLRSQRENLDEFWARADIEVDAPEDETALRQVIRWNLFQVGQASWRAEGTGIPAKGLTGRAYEGHYFWDSEIYLLPFLAYTQPRIARNLLRFRHSMLPKARQRANLLDQAGAMFPWRTINGEEASAYYQAGTAQYHINADIAYAIRRYVDVRGDVNFLAEVGAEVLIETARLWEDLGFYGGDGCFHIHGVTGPDEYTTVVNDNTYTNLMARLNLRYAASAVRRLQAERPEAHAALVHEVRLRPDEPDRWDRAADAMYVPYDPVRGIHPQDDTFLDREVWDLPGTPRERFPLLLHFHPLVIYRFQVLKQADVVMAMFLLSDEFTPEQKRANFEYYDPITTGDSSLSASIQSIVAAEIGDEESADRYFDYAALMDLADIAGNVSDGVHVASAAGVWMALVYGFGGVRDVGGQLRFEPRLPARWGALRFKVRFQDRQLRVSLGHVEERYALEEGDPLMIEVRGEAHEVAVGRDLVLPAVTTATAAARAAAAGAASGPLRPSSG